MRGLPSKAVYSMKDQSSRLEASYTANSASAVTYTHTQGGRENRSGSTTRHGMETRSLQDTGMEARVQLKLAWNRDKMAAKDSNHCTTYSWRY